MIRHMKTIAITIEESALERLDRVTSSPGKKANRSEVIRRAVEEYIGRLEGQLRDERERASIRRHRARLDREGAALVRMGAKL